MIKKGERKRLKECIWVRIARDSLCTSLLGKKKLIDNKGVKQLLMLEHIDLHIQVPRETVTKKDTKCDSKFVKTRNLIRSALKWIPFSDTIFLFMDNAGVHGIDEIIKEHVSILTLKYNIEVVWQKPDSPETNLLDLGYWATHQAIVKQLH
jgi:hypothetical protein